MKVIFTGQAIIKTNADSHYFEFGQVFNEVYDECVGVVIDEINTEDTEILKYVEEYIIDNYDDFREYKEYVIEYDK